MPELPEVETIRRDLDREIAGRRIAAVEASGRRSIRRYSSPERFVASLIGAEVSGAGRHGKYLLVGLADRAEALIVHLRMSGQLLLAPDPLAVARPRHTHVVLRLDDGRELRFVDPRTFGELFVARPATVTDALGPDALSGGVAAAVAPRRRRLKDALMDQRVVAGIGNIYSDEVLWASRLAYDRPASSLTRAEQRRLEEAVRVVLETAIEARGSSLADEQYRDLYGRTGSARSTLRVFGREGEPCSRCGRAITRIRHAGRSHFACPRCQPRR